MWPPLSEFSGSAPELCPWKECNASPVTGTILPKTQLCVRLHNSIPVPICDQRVSINYGGGEWSLKNSTGFR